jgi:hypothetical protein
MLHLTHGSALLQLLDKGGCWQGASGGTQPPDDGHGFMVGQLQMQPAQRILEERAFCPAQHTMRA